MIDRSQIKATLIEVIYKDIVTSQFTELKKYLCEHYENHKDRKDTLDKIISENQGSEFIDTVVDDYNEYSNFDQILYSSQVVIVYSHLEFWMSKIAKKLEHRTTSKIKLSDLNESSDLERARKYINLVGEIELGDLNEVWAEILDYKVIRNIIVHNSFNLFKHQIIKRDKKDFTNQERNAVRIIESNSRLSINLNDGVITISDLNYPLRFCNLCMSFLHSILDKIIVKYSC